MPGSTDWVRRVLAWLPFVASAALVSIAIQTSVEHLWLGPLMLGAVGLVFVPHWIMRRRLSRLFQSADMNAILRTLEVMLRHVKAPETLIPLAKATALTAYGRLVEAQRMLGFARRGQAWEAASEQRLVLEVLQDAFMGQRQRAMTKAQGLLALPLPSSPWARHHARLLREGMAALARAFARVPLRGDVKRLRAAAADEPLLLWAMRYAETIVEIDHGNSRRANELLLRAPPWPQESVFADFHQELEHRAAGAAKRG